MDTINQERVAIHLCSVCSKVGVGDLQGQFKHPLTYHQQLRSAEQCSLCLLFIWSYSKTQVGFATQHSSSYADIVEQLVSANVLHRDSDGAPKLTQDTPFNLRWKPPKSTKFTSQQVAQGDVSGGFSIQVSAPAGLSLNRHAKVPVRELMPPAHEQNVKLMRQWLQACITGHKECSKTLAETICDDAHPAALPGRMIDVGSDTDLAAVARIASTKDILSERYLALSHRWGRIDRLRLLKTNLDELTREIPTSSLLPSIAEAILITRKLGFRYLWIDNLCIVQDDDDDFAREIHNMGTVYENATCTLVALDAITADDQTDRGLFHRERPGPAPAVLANGLVLEPRIPSPWPLIKDTLWNQRGWTMQERFLSRRMIYFSQRALLWECKLESRNEQEPWSHGTSRFPADMPKARVTDRWAAFAEEYSKRRLNNINDTRAAIEGLRERYHAANGLQISYGVLHHPHGLLWFCDQSHAPRTADRYAAPSWSWMSCPRAIASLESNREKTSPDTPPVAPVLTFHDSGRLHVRAQVIHATLGPPLVSTALASYADLLPVFGSLVHLCNIITSAAPPSNTAVLAPEKRIAGAHLLLRRADAHTLGFILLDAELHIGTDVACVVLQSYAANARNVRWFRERVGAAHPDAQDAPARAFVAVVPGEAGGVQRRVGMGQIVRRGGVTEAEAEAGTGPASVVIA